MRGLPDIWDVSIKQRWRIATGGNSVKSWGFSPKWNDRVIIMARGELFDIEDLKQCRKPLSQTEKGTAVREIIHKTKLGIKYFYSLREAGGILRRTYDEILTLIAEYRLDVVLFSSVYKIPWWDLAAFILDEDDDMEEAMNEYLQAIARRNTV
jgi:hypothetical protein